MLLFMFEIFFRGLTRAFRLVCSCICSAGIVRIPVHCLAAPDVPVQVSSKLLKMKIYCTNFCFHLIIINYEKSYLIKIGNTKIFKSLM